MRSKKIIFLLLCLILTGCNSKTYTVTFNTNGGTVMESIKIEEGENLENIDTPTKEGYLFVGWLKNGLEYNQENPINEDLNLTASWTKTPELLKDYTVVFIIDNQEEEIIVKENDLVPQPTTPVKENHKFLGWFLEGEQYDFNNPIKTNLILVAKFEKEMLTVTFDLEGGSGPATRTIQKGKTLPIPDTPEKFGYKFVKWTSNDQDYNFNQPITENITLKAIWEPIIYVTVHFDTDGGNSIKSQIIEKYSAINELPTPEKEGYIFKEWQSNGKKIENETVIKESITLKAIYEKTEE